MSTNSFSLPYWILAAATAGSVLGGGFTKAHYDSSQDSSRLTTIIQTDLNSDGRPDLILETKGGDRYIWLAQEDGTYRRLEDVQKEWKEQAASQSQQTAESIDTKIAEIIAKANGLR